MSSLTISADVLDVLQRSTITDKLLTLPPVQLERPLYEAVNKVLNIAGGVWSKKQKGHLFAEDPRTVLGLALETGQIENKVDDAKAEKKAYQAFYTPYDLAERVANLAEIKTGMLVLEPSAGHGSLVNAAVERGAVVTAVELNPVAVEALRAGFKPEAVTVYEGDFLNFHLRTNEFDRVVMNPPFTRNQDIKHVTKALTHLAPGGILVSVMSPNTRRPGFEDMLVGYHDYEIEEVPAGTFKESGTNIATIILKVWKS